MNYQATNALQWAMPQTAAEQAQQAYQQQAYGESAIAAQPVQDPAVTTTTDTRLAEAGSASAPNVHRNNRLAKMDDKVLVTRTADEETEDGRIRNKEAIKKIRDAWVYKQIRARVDEFTEYKQVCIP